jgi:hypothetical protein
MNHTNEQFFFPTFASMNPAPVVPVQSQQLTKAEKARTIFKEMFEMNPVPARKDMISRAEKEAGLTKNGAATYLQNFKSKNGLTVPRIKA